MSSANLWPLEQIVHLDSSSTDFSDQVSNVLYGEKYSQWAKDIKQVNDGDVVKLIDFLESALDTLDPTSFGFRSCLRELRHICGAKMTLPTSYIVLSQASTVGRQPIASGGSGDVYEGILSGSKVSVKRLRKYSIYDSEKAGKTFHQEVIMWKRLKHKNIVPFLGMTTTPLQLISEWVSGGELTQYIERYPGTNRCGLMSDIAEGLCYLHSRNIVHGDLKGPNVLVDDTGHALITDFGLATVTHDPDWIRTASEEEYHSTPWTAPEILCNKGSHSKEADVFSFAMVMIEVFTGAVPFNQSSTTQALLAVMNGERPPRPTHPNFTNDLWKLMGRCWNQDPCLRPEVSSILRVLDRQNTETSKPSDPMLVNSRAYDPNELQQARGDQVYDYTGEVGKSRTNLQNTPGIGNRSKKEVSGDDSRIDLNHVNLDDKDEYWPERRRDNHGASRPAVTLAGDGHECGGRSQNPSHLLKNASRGHLKQDKQSKTDPPDTSESRLNAHPTRDPSGRDSPEEISAGLTSHRAMEPDGLVPSFNPPPQGLAEVRNRFRGRLAQESIDESGMSAIASVDLSPNRSQGESVFSAPLRFDFETSACKHLIARGSSKTEVLPLIEKLFSSQDEVNMIGYLRGAETQTFIDVIDEALDRTNLPPRLRRKCLSALCKICGRHALLPRSLKIPLCYDRFGTPLYHGGYADVWKGEHQGRQVAVKVLRVYSTTDFEKIISRFCKEVVTWKVLRHPNVLPLLGVTMDNALSLFAMTSEWMKNGNINEFIKGHLDANRFELLKDVAKGLIHMHSQAMIHGDLKGANILINQDGHACLADFGLVTIASDPTNPTTFSSSVKGGTTRWMSPELLDPDMFGIEDSRPTKESDSYALGMVILEVLSGRSPFNQHRDVVVMRVVLEGKRPERPTGPEGAWFTDDLWQMLTLCWESKRKSRPSIEAILEVLEQVSSAWKPPSLRVKGDVEVGKNDWELTPVSYSSGMAS